MVLKWEKIECEMKNKTTLLGKLTFMLRAKVTGGGFVKTASEEGPFFYPDPEHLWDSSSLP